MNLPISQRLAAGFGFLLLLMLAFAAGSALELRNLTLRLNQIVQVDNERTSLANDLLNAIDSMAIQSRSIALVVDITTVGSEVKEFERQLAIYRTAQDALRRALDGPGVDEPSRKLFAEIAAMGERALPSIQHAVKQGAESASVDAAATLDKVRPLETSWRRKVAEFVARQKAKSSDALAAAQTSRRQAATLGLVLLLSAIGSGVVVAAWITRGINRPIRNAILVAERIAEGDLTTAVRTDSRDEVGRLLKAIALMQEKLRALVDQIRWSATSIQTASSEAATDNAELSRRTERAAVKLKATASSMSQLTTMVGQSADAAVRANELATSAATVASRGGAMVGQVISTMGEINASSSKISEIVGIIDGIAMQTNILALNAAVEAARAGEQGLGFAVVAKEIGELAQRSAAAARQIKTLIDSSVERVDVGSHLVRSAGVTMDEIVTSVTLVLSTIAEIAAVASQQSAGIHQVHDAIVLLDQMTQQNSALVDDGARAAESLKGQAVQLADTVSAFTLEA